MSTAKKHAFKAETQKVLSILTHSLYANREIFLREALSNASDALEKVRFLQSKGEVVRNADLPLEIRISIDKIENAIIIQDSGIGMTEKEMIDNLGTIARSGSEVFAREVADQNTDAADKQSPTAEIIGRFGVGFYSLFMVADEVEVSSLPGTGEEGPHIWSSAGADDFSIRPLNAEEAANFKRGTTVKIRLKEDAREFLEKFRLQAIIRKHSNFLPFPVYLEGERINTTPALWREQKFSITREQYDDFYKYLSLDSKPPLDVIHLTVDAPLQYSALIFIPDTPQEFFGEKRQDFGLDLYARRVLIQKANSDILPQYFCFLKGVVDAEDLPLNVSRETLQENVLLRKISQTIINQIFSHLEKMAENDPQKYLQFWKLHGKYFKFAFNDYMQREHMSKFLRFASSATDDLTSLDAYIERIKPGQKEIWYVSAPSLEAARLNPHMERFRRKGIEVLYLLEPVDEFALDSIATYKEHAFKSIEQAENKDIEAVADLSEIPAAKSLSADEKALFDKLLEKIKEILQDRVTEVRLSDRLVGSPAVLVATDGVSSSMERIIRVMQKNDSPPQKILELNPNHPLMAALLRIYTNNPNNPILADFVQSLMDNVQMLDGFIFDPYIMADRNLQLMDKSATWYANTL